MGMSKYDRLLYILNLLRSRKGLNAARLAEECGVTERSIYRDIISLSEANVPIYYDNGYKLASDNFLPALNFTFDEYACLKLALESSPLGRTGRYQEVLKQVRAKVEAGLSQPTKDKKKVTADTTMIDIDVTSPNHSAERFYNAIENAINSRTQVRINYESIEHGRAERVVEPYFIIFKTHAFYFVAFCHLREKFRTFRIDRIIELTPTHEHFTRRTDIKVQDYFEGSWRIYGGEPTDVIIRFSGKSARVIAGGCHHPREEKTEPDSNGVLEYRVRVNGTEEIKRWLLGYGNEAEVVAPLSLRREIGQIGKDISLNHRVVKT